MKNSNAVNYSRAQNDTITSQKYRTTVCGFRLIFNRASADERY